MTDAAQAGTMVREVLDDAARERLVSNVVGHLLNAVLGSHSSLHFLWGFKVWSGADPRLLNNVRFLAGYRRRSVIVADAGREACDSVHADGGPPRLRPRLDSDAGDPVAGRRPRSLRGRYFAADVRAEDSGAVYVRVGFRAGASAVGQGAVEEG